MYISLLQNQATDICDPNPILMLMFCVFLYEKLPQFVPKEVVIFNCTLHESMIKTVRIYLGVKYTELTLKRGFRYFFPSLKIREVSI